MRTRLAGHPPIPSTQTGGGCLVFLGMPFVAFGVFVLLASLGLLDVDLRARNGGPAWMVTAFGAVFAAVGASVVWGGLAGMARARAARKRREEHPLEPWYWDHPWDSRCAQSGSLGAAIQTFVVFLFLEGFLSMFHWWAFFSDDRVLPLMFIVGLFDLFALIVLLGAFYQLFQHLKYGTSRLHFARFPFRPGQSVEGGLEVSRKVTRADRLTLNLRFLEEVTETKGEGKNRSSQQVLYCLHEVKQELNAAQFDAGSDLDIPISLRLPEGDFSNQLLATPRRYWELEVKADTPGIDYEARFLLPVYAAAQNTQTTS